MFDSSNYIDHYKYLDCKAIASKDCPQCIERFDCPRLPLDVKELDIKKCYVATQSFSVGESILSKRKFCKYCTCVDVPLPPTGTPADYDDNNEDDDEETTQPNTDFNATALLMNRPEPKSYNPTPIDTNYEARVTCTAALTPFSVLVNTAESNEYCFYKENECRFSKHCLSKEKFEKGKCSLEESFFKKDDHHDELKKF